MHCPGCGAPMRITESNDSLRCEYCHSLYTPPKNEEGARLLGQASPLACPVCALPLEQAALAGHQILACSKCQGMLVSMNDFVALIEELRSEHSGSGNIQPAPDPGALERHIDCPRCHRRMDTHFYEGPGNIVIDDCSPCSLNWLDKGELARVIHAPDHSYAQDRYGR